MNIANAWNSISPSALMLAAHHTMTSEATTQATEKTGL